MLSPVTRWIRQISNGLLYNLGTIEPQRPPEYTVPTANVLQNLCPLDPNALPILLQTTPGDGSTDPLTPVSYRPGTTRALVEDPLAQSSLLVNSLSATFNNPSILPAQIGLGMSPTIESTLHSQPGLGQLSCTMTLPPAIGLSSDQQNIPKPRYFTFDGQHRKFYLSARYLRSAQRQRRHRRRVAQRLKEQARAEMNQIQNAISYGYPGDTRQPHTPREKTIIPPSESAPDKTLDIVSITSEVANENGIPLLCWKDIDLDLEVRSIDDETELARLTRRASKDKNGRTPTAQEPRFSKLQPSFACIAPSIKDMEDINLEHEYSQKSPKIVTIGQESEAKKYTINTLKRMWPTTKHNKISVSTEPTILENTMISSLDKDQPNERTPAALQALRPVPANKPRIGQTLSPGHSSTPAGYHSIKQITPTHSTASAMLNQSVLPQNRYPKQISTLPTFTQNITSLPPIKGSSSFQNEHIQSLLHSTVISNPAALDSVDSELDERALIHDKSRLSLVSSRGDLNSDVQVQLSYYSQQESVKTEEDLSFFSFRDRFSTKEDISKVTVPISLSLLIMTTYIVIGAVVFSKWENEGYLKWSYFCFITLSTIGFGDIVPGK
ncbi:unnamed protein product [Echinostoma caproni]|uniref:Ion_trans_2 domain-containing protein n=1 Tax=Echinostoma caproni TaxID=27848 RepID=A0A183AFX5_9TREM|nr:unnamed protein product [Echinostoma caproni]